jgi:hypothetical protein
MSNISQRVGLYVVMLCAGVLFLGFHDFSGSSNAGLRGGTSDPLESSFVGP